MVNGLKIYTMGMVKSCFQKGNITQVISKMVKRMGMEVIYGLLANIILVNGWIISGKVMALCATRMAEDMMVNGKVAKNMAMAL